MTPYASADSMAFAVEPPAIDATNVSDSEPPRFAADHETRGRRALVLAVFIAIGTVNLLDRQILSIAAEALKADLGLSDSLLGLLSGATFAIFYAAFGLPMAWLADRKDRPRLIAIAMTLRSFEWALPSVKRARSRECTRWSLTATRRLDGRSPSRSPD